MATGLQSRGAQRRLVALELGARGREQLVAVTQAALGGLQQQHAAAQAQQRQHAQRRQPVAVPQQHQHEGDQQHQAQAEQHQAEQRAQRHFDQAQLLELEVGDQQFQPHLRQLQRGVQQLAQRIEEPSARRGHGGAAG